jgi:hypothetical protein
MKNLLGAALIILLVSLAAAVNALGAMAAARSAERFY